MLRPKLALEGSERMLCRTLQHTLLLHLLLHCLSRCTINS